MQLKYQRAAFLTNGEGLLVSHIYYIFFLADAVDCPFSIGDVVAVGTVVAAAGGPVLGASMRP